MCFCKKNVLHYVAVFLRCFDHPGRSKGWAHMQFLHAGAVKTHFFIFALFLKKSFPKTSFGVHFGVIFEQQFDFSVKKEASKTVSKKGPPPDANSTLFRCQEAPGQPPRVRAV